MVCDECAHSVSAGDYFCVRRSMVEVWSGGGNGKGRTNTEIRLQVTFRQFIGW